jgi:hypothetical protein
VHPVNLTSRSDVRITQWCNSRTPNLKEHSKKDSFSQETECSQISSNQGSEADFCAQQGENRRVTSSVEALWFCGCGIRIRAH